MRKEITVCDICKTEAPSDVWRGSVTRGGYKQYVVVGPTVEAKYDFSGSPIDCDICIKCLEQVFGR